MMQFAKTIDKVLSGEKTATSRIVKPGDTDTIKWTVALADYTSETSFEASHIVEVKLPYHVAKECEIMRVMNNGRTIYRVGQDYAAQPGRGQKAVGRIRITGIERYDVRTITHERALLEGFKDMFAFLSVWTLMHDEIFYARWAGELHYDGYKRNAMLAALEARQAAKYDAWFIRFELLKGGE